MQNYSDEIAWLKKQLEEHPESMLFARLAERYLQLAEVEQAIEVCKTGLKYHSKYPTAHFILAKCFYAHKMYDEAEKQLKKVINFDPNYLRAHKIYGDLMSEIGWLSSVESSYNKILQVDPMDKKTQHSLKQLKNTEAEVTPDSPARDDRYNDQFDSSEEIARYSTAQSQGEPPVLKEKFVPEDEPGTDTRIDSPEEPDTEFTPQTFEDEESRFSEILDDIFSPYLDEEERREKVIQHSLAHKKPKEMDSFIEKEETSEMNFQPDQKAQTDTAASQLQQVDDLFQKPESAQDESDFFNTFVPEDSMDSEIPAQPVATAEQNVTEDLPESRQDQVEPEEFLTFGEPDEEPLNSAEFGTLKTQENLEEQELDFGEFLSTLDVRDLTENLEMEEDLPVENIPGNEKTTIEQVEKAEPMMPESQQPTSAEGRFTEPKDKFVTPTLGEIYAAQGQYAKAISVFEILQKRYPENEWYASKLEYLRKRLAEEQK